jgi:hypothetical protein
VHTSTLLRLALQLGEKVADDTKSELVRLVVVKEVGFMQLTCV